MTSISYCVLCPWHKEFNSSEWARKELNAHRYIVHGIDISKYQMENK